MPKRASDAREGRPKRRRADGGMHQRHRTKAASVLAMPGATGIFVSCARGKERKAALELVDALSEHAAQLYPPGVADDDDMDALRNGPPPAPRAAPVDDIESQVHAELAALRAPSREHVVALDTDTECLCFLACPAPVDATRLVVRLLQETEDRGETRSRFVQRLTPVRALCHADTESIRAAAPRALRAAFPKDRACTYRIEPRIRAHTSLTRDSLIPLMAACVPADEGHRVDLARPDVIVVVEVLRNVCGIGALHDYERWAKYNVQTLAERRRT
ncbi:hypothetical protein MCAP1_002886 [Malassezia caprae]|uniref:THUMP domain-containing protein n=1 Tax=Malassezia caprae TaxID=1381934 RepID=A0AAF0E6M8_9BASI|nr:hypothetical protein MCAP1_002886 [Malassezia caprae]